MTVMQWYSTLNPVTQVVIVFAVAWVVVTAIRKLPY